MLVPAFVMVALHALPLYPVFVTEAMLPAPGELKAKLQPVVLVSKVGLVTRLIELLVIKYAEAGIVVLEIPGPE